MPQFSLLPSSAALFGFTVAGDSFVVNSSPSNAGNGNAVIATIPARVGYAVLRFGFRKVTSNKFIVEQILGGLGLSKLATTRLADPDIAYNPDSGLIMIAGQQYYADPPPPLLLVTIADDDTEFTPV